ncbi:unnamed protein product [Allacma fusca]|uniref:Embryonic stem cell-specific 5-hydroxymethylcytosine-binding protein n=1 Tax=Allacma fusca TaxID=39272 RepID=A0A8J2LEP6_9HEXA|nr:unnamed protein product [Allacma fusca]
MCGRTACTLAPGVIQEACSYVDPATRKYRKPEWKEHPSTRTDNPTSFTYYPSANMTPTKFTPVLFKGYKSDEMILQPMMWGMIPPWHKGEPKSHGMSTNNCRIEGLNESKLFRRALKNKNVCVIVAQGFYEWKTVGESNKKTPKQPYFIFTPPDESKGFGQDGISDEEAWNRGTWSEDEGWTGPKILMMAGLYDVWNNPDGEPVYSYSIITMESNDTLSWLHHRMPAIIETPEQLHAWLNPAPDASSSDMLKILKPADSLEWYTVSTKVNNSRCNDMDCAKRFEIKENKSKTFMDNWLKRTPKVKEEMNEEIPSKKPKLEDSK